MYNTIQYNTMHLSNGLLLQPYYNKQQEKQPIRVTHTNIHDFTIQNISHQDTNVVDIQVRHFILDESKLLFIHVLPFKAEYWGTSSGKLPAPSATLWCGIHAAEKLQWAQLLIGFDQL